MGRWIELPIREITERYEAGEGTLVLGGAYGVSDTTIRKRLHAAGIKIRERGRPRKPGGPLHDGRGYLYTSDREGNECRIHRALWEAYHGPIPDGRVVHHLDGDPMNNDIENLACISNSEHVALHNVRRWS